LRKTAMRGDATLPSIRHPAMTLTRLFHLAAFALAALLYAGGAAGLSDDDQQCLACHAQKGLKKDLGKGEALPLHVSGDEFAHSVHAELGCSGCHADIDLKEHPGTGRKIGSAREFAVAETKLCAQCHEDKAKLFDGSIHAALLRQGNLWAPVCTDCHGAHDVRPVARESMQSIPCRKCHDDIYEIYAKSVHGVARAAAGPVKAPICTDCHRAHDVSPASDSARLRAACLGCHKNGLDAHAKWLPNTRKHLEVVACAACHAPGAQKRVDLRLYDTSTRQPMSDAPGRELNAQALLDLLRGAGSAGAPARATLVGRLEVSAGAEAHQLAAKSRAVRDCVTCHRKGAAAFQNVTISIIGPDGRPLRYEAHKEVLSNPASVESVSNFYVIGGTRIRLLDALLALALLAGISAPVAHLLLRRVLRRRAARGRDASPPST
jgi:hypothetical protein